MRNIFIILLLLLSCCCFRIYGQQRNSIRIKIDKADYLRHDDKVGRNTQSLNGHVVLSHVNTVLYCDSAYMYNDSNVVVAYGNVHLIQNDSIHLYGKVLTYYGDNDLVKVRDDVRVNKSDVWLYTQYLDYDRKLNMAYYLSGGRVVNRQNLLVSDRGLFFPYLNELYFKDNVKVSSPSCTIVGDTMKYNTATEIVGILGPTQIVNNDSVIINSDDGWYDTKADCANLMKNNRILSGSNILSGNHILYDNKSGEGRVFGDMILENINDNVSLRGEMGFYNEISGAAYATGKAMAVQVYNGDSLYVHADTFRIIPVVVDSSKMIIAYNSVKFFREDMQGRCDSLVFTTRDSIATLYHNPVIWAYGNQMTANEIKCYMTSGSLSKTELLNSAFVISPLDTLEYNQIKGKIIVGYIKNNDLYKIEVNGNGQAVYYPTDNDAVIGVNKSECSNMTIWTRERKVTNIVLRVSPNGNVNPTSLVSFSDCQLSGFRWLECYRPKSPNDIFLLMDMGNVIEGDVEQYEDFIFDELGE